MFFSFFTIVAAAAAVVVVVLCGIRFELTPNRTRTEHTMRCGHGWPTDNPKECSVNRKTRTVS